MSKNTKKIKSVICSFYKYPKKKQVLETIRKKKYSKYRQKRAQGWGRKRISCISDSYKPSSYEQKGPPI